MHVRNNINTFSYFSIVPNNISLFASTNHVLTIGWNAESGIGRAQLEIIMFKIMDQFLRTDIPNFYCVIFWGWNNIFFIRSDSYTGYWVCVSIFQFHDWIFWFCVPDSYATVVVAGSDISLGSWDMHIVAFWIRIDCPIDMCRIQIPQFDRWIKWGRHNTCLRKTEFCWRNCVLVSDKGMLWSNVASQRI